MSASALQQIEAVEKRATFIDALGDTLTFTKAARIAGVHITRVYQWFQEDPAFKQLAYDAQRQGKEITRQLIEDAMIASALTPKGTLDRIFALKALAPNTYRDDAQRRDQNVTFNQYVIVPATTAPNVVTPPNETPLRTEIELAPESYAVKGDDET